ncbi:MAG: sigma factor, partial [Planctomycetota bacterium]
MTNPADPQALSIEELLEQEVWLRPLLRSLVQDEDAEDVLQDTWLRVLRRPPKATGSLRSWL